MKTTVFLAGLLLAGGTAGADELPDGPYDPHEARPAKPAPITDLRVEAGPEDKRVSAETVGVNKDDLIRKAVITIEGDEIGVIRDIGYSESRSEPVVIVDIDAFIGVGDKRIAIPLSQIDRSDPGSDSVTTTLTRNAVENVEAVDDTDITAIE